MPRTRGNVERRRNSLSDADLENIGLKMELATTKAFELHKEKDHVPMWQQIDKLSKFQTGIMAVIGFIGFVGTLAWGEIKGIFFHGGH